MTGEIEALGAAATAGLAAHALSPDAGGAAAAGRCRNCDAPLGGKFCASCGQAAELPRTMRHVFHEFLHGLLHFDGKAWKTLPMLVFRPGRLTRDYVHGKRARYVPPLALFLFAIFMTFFAFSWVEGPDLDQAMMAVETDPVEAEAGLREAEAALADARRDLAEAKADPDPTPGMVGILSGRVAATEAAVAEAKRQAEAARAGNAAVPLPADLHWQDRLRREVTSGELRINTGSADLDGRIRAALLNPDLTLYKIQQKAYKLSFLLVPLSLPFIWLLFPFRRDVTMYDHTVFALYSLSFMSMLAIVAMLLTTGPPAVADRAGALLLAVPVHMFAQLKGAYALGWGGALWRTFWLGVFACIVTGLFTGGIVLLGLVD
jgi:hypothetical protein